MHLPGKMWRKKDENSQVDSKKGAEINQWHALAERSQIKALPRRMWHSAVKWTRWQNNAIFLIENSQPAFLISHCSKL